MVDGVFQMGADGALRARVMMEAETLARERAIAAGADPARCQVRVVSIHG